jgi:hypothetical protein
MAGRKNELSYYPQLNQVDASTSHDNFDNPTGINWLDNAGIVVKWTGTPVGVFHVWVSNDKKNPDGTISTWTELDFGTSILVDNTNTSIAINMNQLPFSWIAVSYEATSGSGTLTSILSIKEV